MKKNLKWILAIIGIAIVASIAVVGTLLRNVAPSQINVEITGTPVDNGYNNYLSNYDAVGNLVRIGDKLYYNCYGGYSTYGLYEITAEGATRIYWDGYVPVLNRLGFQPEFYPIREYDGKLLMNTKVNYPLYVYNENTKEKELKKCVIQAYREESQIFEEDAFFCDVADISKLMYQETSFGFVYESFEGDALWVYTEETGAKQIVSEHLCSFYTTGEHIYYTVQSNLSDPFVLHMFDWNSQIDTVICQWTECSFMSYFFLEGNNLIFMASDSAENTRFLCKLELNNPLQKETVLYAIDENNPDSPRVSSWNVWNGAAYLCTDDGLIVCDLETGAHRILCDKAVINCDIVDDVWVYFVEEDSYYLWRVPQSGGTAELVFKP